MPKKIIFSIKRTLNIYPLILKSALRNLVRQRRRNILLAIAMAFGLIILIMAGSFAAGISDIIMNQFIALVAGHMQITVREEASVRGDIIRDRDRFFTLIKETVPDVVKIEEACAVWARVLGHGKADGLILVGLDKKDRSSTASFRVAEGSLDDFYSQPDAAIIYKSKAKNLGVKIGDEISARLQTVYGRQETAKYYIAAILENASMFQDMSVCVDLPVLKEKMGLEPQEAKVIQVLVKNPLQAKKFADSLHKKLVPKIACLHTSVDNIRDCLIAAPDNLKTNEFLQNIKFTEGKFSPENKDSIMLSSYFKKNGYKTGSQIIMSYESKFHGLVKKEFRISGFFSSAEKTGFLTPQGHALLYYEHLPVKTDDSFFTGNLAAALAREWILLRRSPTTRDIQVKFAELGKSRWKGQALDVRTMYETGEQMLQLEQAMNSLTFIAVLVILAISLIGVMNTLGMTIRERSQEIGTLRSIGMQQTDVRRLFTSEFMLIAVLASISGVLLSLLLMAGLSSIPIKSESMMTMFLKNNHLYFMITPGSIISACLSLVIVTGIFAFFPARKASRMNPAEVLRKME